MSDTNQALTAFTAGDLVISVYGDGDGSGAYGLNQAAPIVLEEVTTAGTVVGDMVLPQTTTVVNGVTENAISGEYGSASEGLLQLSADGQSLVIAGYGVSAEAFNTGGAAAYGTPDLGQTTSEQGGPYTAVPRVIADISYNGTVDTSTALYNVDNENNPRSVATENGTSFYLSGQGISGDTTQGVVYAQDGASSATTIDDTSDTREVEIINGQLYVSRDSTQIGGGEISSYGTVLPISNTVGMVLPGIGNSITLNATQVNGVNNGSVGQSINLSPESYFFATPDILYVADSGNPKDGGIGDGGLQKWMYSNGSWNLEYTLSAGLGLVADTSASGTTGLIGLTGTVLANGTVVLYATNSTVTETGQSYLYGITDTLTATTAAVGESFVLLETAAPDTIIRGVAFAPTASASTTSSTTISGGSTQSGVQVTSGFFLDIQSGGTAVGATIFSGGSGTVELGGVDSGSYIAQGAQETVLGSATGDGVDGLQLVSAGAAVSNEIILNGGTVELLQTGAIGNDLTVASGGFLVLSGGATADNTVISGGTLDLDSANAVLGGTLTFESTGTIAITANIASGYGGQAIISGFVAGDAIDFTAATAIGAGGSTAALFTTTSGGNTYATVSGGGSSETFEFTGTTISGYLTLTSDGHGGEILTALPMSTTVSSGTTSSGLVVSGGFFLDVLSGGTIDAATIQSGGSATVQIGAIDSGSTIAAGGFETVSGTANQDKIYGTQLVSAGTAIVSNETIFNGGTVDLFLAGVIANNTTVLAGGTLAINGHAIADDTVISGGVLELQSPKATVSGSLTFAGAGTLAFTDLTDAGYGDLAVISNFGTGDVVDEALIGSGATLTAVVSGVDTIATITSGGVSETLIFAGPAPSNLSLVSDGNGGEEIVYSAVTPTVISVAGGTTSTGVIVTSGSTLNVLAGGTIVSASILSGGSATVSAGGTDSGSVIAHGGYEMVLGSATGDLVGGIQVASASASVISNETIVSGGVVELNLAGATANNLTVDSGGVLVISGHATADDTVISGGVIELQSAKAVLSGSLTFVGPGAVDVTATITTSSGSYGDQAVISGFNAEDVIDFTAATAIGAAGSSATLIVTSSGGDTIATVSGGGSTQAFIFAGTAVAGALILRSDGNGGEEITLSSTPPTSITVPSGITSTGNLVTSGSFVDVLSGGTLVSAMIQYGGSATVELGGTDSGSVISAGGFETVSGSATLDQVYGTQLVSAGTAVISNETIFNGGAVELFLAGATASNTTVASGGILAISGHAIADNTVVSGGGLVELESPKATLAGSLTFAGAATLEITAAIDAGYGDLATISGFAAGDVIDETAIGNGATFSATISGGNTVATITSGSVTETLIFAGSVTSNLSMTSDGRGGEEVVFGSGTSSGSSGTTPPSSNTIVVSGGVISSGLTISNGYTLDVQSGGTAVSATILAGGFGTIEANGYDSGTFISAGGSETVFGSATFDQVGGTQVIDGGVASETIMAGGSATVEVGATDSGSTIATSGTEVVYGSANLDQVYGTQIVSSAGTGSGGIVSNETVFNGGTINLDIAGAAANAVAVDSGTLILNGHVIATDTVISGGLIELESAKATLSGTLTFSGGGTIEVTGNTSAGYGDLAVISGFAGGDVIDLSSATKVGSAGSSATFTTSASGGNTVVTVSGGGSTEAFIFAGTVTSSSFTLGSDGNGGVDLTEVACFLPGTHILTVQGEVEVEKLQVGDRVVTASGQHRPLCWIGQGRALATRGQRGAATPLIVRKGALADNVPHCDLRITKGHSLYVDDVLIPVEFLVNHRSILWDDHAQEVTVYHLELDTHDVLVANGAPPESYRDDGNRWLFRNANTGWDQPAKAPCAPVLTGGAVVDAVWRRLLDRAGPAVRVPLTDEPDLHLLVDGQRIDATRCEGGVYVFNLAARPDSVRIVSRASAAQELGLARDPRCLGVALRRIVVRQGKRNWTIEANDPRLVNGFHQYESANGFVWTDGDAALPTDLTRECSGALEIVLKVAGITRYIDEGVRLRVA